MKKISLLAAVFAMAALTACGGNKTENVQTEAATTAADAGTAEDETTEAEDEYVDTIVELPEEYEQEFFEGEMADLNGIVLTVNSADGTSMKFDISNADVDTENMLVGAYVEVSYAPEAEKDGIYAADYAIVTMDIEEYAENENRDPMIWGTLQLMDINDLVILDDNGVEHNFDNNMSRTVAFGDLSNGDRVRVTYCGTIYEAEEDENEDDEDEDEGIFSGMPYAIKIVAEDAVGSEDAEANYIDGVVGPDNDNGLLTLDTSITTFECSGDADMLSQFKDEDKVRVYYEGSLAGVAIEAVKIESRS